MHRLFIHSIFGAALTYVVIACGGAATNGGQSQSSDDGGDDAGGSASSDAGLATTTTDAGKKTSPDAGATKSDGGATVTPDAGPLSGSWSTEAFSNPHGLQITQIIAHPTAARTLVLAFESGFFATRAAEWIDGTLGTTFTGTSSGTPPGTSADTFQLLTYVSDGSAYATDSSGAGSTLQHLATGASGREWTTALSLGSAMSRPPQAPFGPWPPSNYRGALSSTRLLASANETFIDLSPANQTASSWPELELPYPNIAATAMFIDWFAIDETDDTSVLVGMHPQSPSNAMGDCVAHCTVPNPATSAITCNDVASDQGLPTGQTQSGGWVAPSNASEVYVITSTQNGVQSLYRSDDGAAHFSAVSLPATSGLIGTLAVDTVDASTAVFCVGGAGISGQIFLTKDGGATWSTVTAPGNNQFTCGAFDAAGTYFAGYGSTLVSQSF